jgi:hypothetical protein
MAKKDFLDQILEHCNISNDHKEFVVNKLFKYKNNPIVQTVCSIISINAAEHNKLLDMWQEIRSILPRENEIWPLIIPCPNNSAALRVFPNIMLNTHRKLENISTSTSAITLATFLAEYEEDIADDKKKQKWEPLERATKLLNDYLDMPTARALSRYVFTNGKIKDDTIRDFADAIDNFRKPLELIFAETPEDFVTMYGSGPQSCMAYSAGERSSWLFLEEKYKQCPASWYAYYPYTKGVYAVKAGKVIARAICFADPKKGFVGPETKWQYGRVYPTTPEIDRKFKETLHQNGITELSSVPHTPLPSFEFTIPGVLKDSGVYAAPWPYFDNINRGAEYWNVAFDKDTHEFKIQFDPSKYLSVNNRSGHIISSDYITLECSSCGNPINMKKAPVIPVEAGEHAFCSDNCAASYGYHRVIQGNQSSVYKRLTEEMVSLKDDSFVKFSTIKAAQNCGYLPLIEELGVFPEENDYKVAKGGEIHVKSSDGTYFFAKDIMRLGLSFNPNKVPFNIADIKKEVQFNEEELVMDL